MFIKKYNDKKVGFLDVEMIAVQLRKVIEGIAYGCVAACELGGEKLSEEVIDAYDARRVFVGIKDKNLNFVPRPCVFVYKEDDEGIEEWNVSKKDIPRSAALNSANDYLRAYKTLHRYAHEFHPSLPHHLLYKDGLERAISILQPIKKKLTNTLWQHVMPFGNQALVVDFGEKDDQPPKSFVFHQGDDGPAWPILYLITELK